MVYFLQITAQMSDSVLQAIKKSIGNPYRSQPLELLLYSTHQQLLFEWLLCFKRNI
jgi:hypothetical protein